jgi:hypothetical protein
MVLVDTSIWIRFLTNQAPYAEELDRLLALDEVAGHELVYGELLIGDRGGRRKLLTAYERIDQARRVPHHDVVEFVRSRNLQEEESVGSIFTCWPRQLWGASAYGRWIPAFRRWPRTLVSHTIDSV